MNIAISGFSDSPDIKERLENIYNISETVDDNVKFLLVKDSIDYIQCMSSKIKHAMIKKIPIISYEDLVKEKFD